MIDETYKLGRPYKWIENIEREVTDELWEDIKGFFGVEEVTDLTEDNINEIQAYRDEIEDDGYLDILRMGLGNIINWWENETHVDD
ncbi:hypothetical protein N8864_05325 [Gammaproteobacteria bacterium]|nr:hypothetical protein [Gammaproteobacteria bacterium]